MRLLARFMSVAALMLAFGCGGGDGGSEPASDCRNIGCVGDFSCQLNADDAYECLPTNQGGSAGDGGSEGGAAGQGGSAGDGGSEGGSAGQGGSAGPCDGQTDGTVVTEGTFGDCGYADACILTGLKTRTDSICQAGVPTDTVVESAEGCDRAAADTDGTVVAEGTFGACEYTDACILTGLKTRTDSVCQAGVPTDTVVESAEGCDRAAADTDGTVVAEGTFGACEYTDACILTGLKTRTDSVCQAGVPTDTVVESAEGCDRAAADTDGTVVAEGGFGDCAGFVDICDLEGAQDRIDQVCAAGIITDTTVTQTCTREPLGIVETMDSVAACMTAAGGTLTLGDASATLPADALTEDTVVTLTHLGPQAVAGYTAYGDSYRLEGGDAVFALPVDLTLPFTGNADDAVLFWQADAGYTRLPGTIANGLLTADISNFGEGFVGNGIEFNPEVNRECVRMRTLEGRVQDPGIVGMFFTVDDCNGNPITNLTDADFEVFEDGNRLIGAEAPRAVLNRDGLGVFVTLLLDISASTNEHLEQVKAAASAFVTELQVTRNLPVHISVELFAGGESSTVWQSHFLDADTLLEKIATIDQYEAPSPLRSNINGAVVNAVSNVEASAAAFRERNRGGAFTAEYVLVFTDGYDNASLVDSQTAIDAAAASTAEVIGVGLNTESYRPAELEALSEGSVLVAQTSDELAREFQTLAARIDAQTERVYALVYCTPSGAGEHTASVRLSGDIDQEFASYTFAADGMSGCQSADDIVGLCEAKECGGLGCGACDDSGGVVCTPSLECSAIHGDGLVRGTEECDDGNLIDGDGCTAEGGIEDGWRCEGEPSDCASIRGDGLIVGNEECDDGNLADGDGCSADGVIEENWRCEGEPSMCDGIRADGLIRGSEVCDDGNLADGDGCSADGVIEENWRCEGEPSMCDGIRADGLIRGSEVCDDGNLADGDGCSAAGTFEAGWGCAGEPSVCTDWSVITFISILGGTFDMGSTYSDWEQPIHSVTVPSFKMSQSEVTIGQYRVCVDAGVCSVPRCNFPATRETDDHPVRCVTWHEAKAFAGFADARLPSEAEWEYAARSGGQNITYPWGNDEPDCNRLNLVYTCVNNTTPVCSYPSGNTAQGLCDMSGNVWEWVEDDWHNNYIGAPADGSSWIDDFRGRYRVRRGGEGADDFDDGRAAVRNRSDQSAGYYRLGFRLARDVP